MRAPAKLFLTATAIALTAGAAAQSSKPPFEIRAVMDKSEAKVGSLLRLRLALTNTSNQPVDSTPALIHGPVFDVRRRDIDVQVRDSSGDLVPETEYGKTAHGRSLKLPEGVRQSSRPGVGHGGSNAIMGGIPPGETYVEDADLNKEFELTKPGKYTVRGLRKDPRTGQTVLSNDVEFVLK